LTRTQVQIVKADPDDNKLTDCAIAAGADYLISEDAHFKALDDSGFAPKLFSPSDFITNFIGRST